MSDRYFWDGRTGVIESKSGRCVLYLKQGICTARFRNRVGAVLTRLMNEGAATLEKPDFGRGPTLEKPEFGTGRTLGADLGKR